MPRHKAAPRKKQPKAITSDASAVAYLGRTVVYRRAPPIVKKSAPSRCVYIFTDSLCRYPRLLKDFWNEPDSGR